MLQMPDNFIIQQETEKSNVEKIDLKAAKVPSCVVHNNTLS